MAVAVPMTTVSVNQINRARFSVSGVTVDRVICCVGEQYAIIIAVGEGREMLSKASHYRLARKQRQNENGYRATKFKHWLYCRSFVYQFVKDCTITQPLNLRHRVNSKMQIMFGKFAGLDG
jgi:hypothetical protein